MLRASIIDGHDVIGPNDPPRYFPDYSALQRDIELHRTRLLDLPQEGNTREDWTARLPDELLVAIVDELPTLRDKLQVESVSHRFQRCVMKSFLKPMPFELELVGEQQTFVNGYSTDEWEQIVAAVQMLARKTKFNSIVCSGAHPLKLDYVFSLLVQLNTGCLDKVTSFKTYLLGNPDLLQQVLAKCPLLSTFDLITSIQPEIDWGPALNNKALTHLRLKLMSFSQAQLVALLQSIKPNMLKTFRLECVFMTQGDPVALVRGFGVGAWAALEEIYFDFGHFVTVQWADVFASLGRLPKLHKCYIKIHGIEHDQLVSALTSLFSCQKEIIIVSTTDYYGPMPYCQFVNRIRRVQAVHPALQVDFDIAVRMLKLSLGRVTFEGRYYLSCCDDNSCINCGSLYPTLIKKMRELARQQVDAHLDNGRLDRCKIDRVVGQLNHRDWSEPLQRLALAVETDEHLATITFESETDTHQFKITVSIGRCLSNNCIKCIPID